METPTLTEITEQFRKELPPPIAERAVANIDMQFVASHCPRRPAIDELVDATFSWANTREGPVFWEDVSRASRGSCRFPSVKTLR